MRIAVDTRLLQENKSDNYFIKGIIYPLAKFYQEHQFIFFFDKPVAGLHNLPENVTAVTITPAITNILGYKWWLDVKLPRAMKKHHADVFIGTYGLCSLNTAIPQVLVVPDLTFLHFSVFMPENIRFFYKKFTSGFVKKAAEIVTFSAFTKEEIIKTFLVSEQKITVIGSPADATFRPLNWEEREKVKEQYAQGCEYFIFTGDFDPVNNMLNLLKAFSIFKKWQKTNMKLVITADSEKYKNQSKKLISYKYKNEIHIAENLTAEELARLTGGAYAMVFPSFYAGLGLTVLQAMQCQVPVITSDNSSMSEAAGDAALYADPAKPAEIAEHLKRIFKDEQLRNKLIAAGKEQVKLYNPDKTSALMWQAIGKAVSR